MSDYRGVRAPVEGQCRQAKMAAFTPVSRTHRASRRCGRVGDGDLRVVQNNLLDTLVCSSRNETSVSSGDDEANSKSRHGSGSGSHVPRRARRATQLHGGSTARRRRHGQLSDAAVLARSRHRLRRRFARGCREDRAALCAHERSDSRRCPTPGVGTARRAPSFLELVAASSRQRLTCLPIVDALRPTAGPAEHGQLAVDGPAALPEGRDPATLAVRKDRRPKGWQTAPQYLVERAPAFSSRPPRPRAGECLALADVQWPERVCAAQRGPKAD